jgi:hypothetical protein
LKNTEQLDGFENRQTTKSVAAPCPPTDIRVVVQMAVRRRKSDFQNFLTAVLCCLLSGVLGKVCAAAKVAKARAGGASNTPDPLTKTNFQGVSRG